VLAKLLRVLAWVLAILVGVPEECAQLRAAVPTARSLTVTSTSAGKPHVDRHGPGAPEGASPRPNPLLGMDREELDEDETEADSAGAGLVSDGPLRSAAWLARSAAASLARPLGPLPSDVRRTPLRC
jgi:hypothetical protein